MVKNLVAKVHYVGVVANPYPSAGGMGVYSDVESEGIWRQIIVPRNTNPIRHNRCDETAKKIEALKLPGLGL